MTLWMPNKKRPLYAPMLGSLGGGSARGFGRGLGGGAALFDFTSMTFLATTGTGYHDENTTFVAGARIFEESNTLSNYQANYNIGANPWLSDTNHYSLIRAGFQKFTIPETADYRFRVAGASGVDDSSTFASTAGRGLGAIMQAEFSLTAGDYVQIVVAKQGNWQGAGGGASFVADSSGNPLIIAGGGGSPWSEIGSQPYVDAPNSTIGNRAVGNSNVASAGYGGIQTHATGYGVGAGWYSDNSSSLSNDRQSARLKDDARGGGYKNSAESYQGMFGGGGGAISSGAGYTGGTGSNAPYVQGGGGSFISSTCTGNNVGTITGGALARSGSEPDSVYTGGGSALGHNTAGYCYVSVTKV